MENDVFMSHASEEKATIVEPLTRLLEEAGKRVWLDKDRMRAGNYLQTEIDAALNGSRYGVVVFSEAFFMKPWAKRELAALLRRSSDVQTLTERLNSGSNSLACDSPIA